MSTIEFIQRMFTKMTQATDSSLIYVIKTQYKQIRSLITKINKLSASTKISICYKCKEANDEHCNQIMEIFSSY